MTDSTDNALKPCPFCGGEAERITLEDNENFGGDVICCTDCQASSNVEFVFKENLVANWNRRAALSPDPLADPRVAALVEALREVSQSLDWQAHGSCRGWSENLMTSVDALSKARAALAALSPTGGSDE